MKCPKCGKKLEAFDVDIDLDWSDDSIIINIDCSKCGYVDDASIDAGDFGGVD